jgi:uncharacterized protein involved in exopolysaccharide biosynthesis
MYPASDGFEFLAFLWRRRWIVIVACATALAITAAVSLLLPPRFTATASVLIEPPGGNDPRAATAISPVYLESLKTYEHLASSDTLFSRALDDLHLREKFRNATVESLKRRILSVNKPPSTTIIEISATLDDPRQAQALAEYMAQHTVELNSQLDEASNRDISKEPQRIYTEAVARRERAEKARDQFAKSSQLESLEKQQYSASDLKSDVARDLARAHAELAEELARSSPSDVGAIRARIQELQAQNKQLAQTIGETSKTLENLAQTRDSLDAELKSARAAEEAAKLKLNDVEASAAFRGVRLKILDPGIVPQRPSFPNATINLIVALVISFVGAIAFLALQFAWKRIRAAHSDPVYSLRSFT